ncbi:MAG TPA: ATP-binding protein [Vicinamibacterales bacterium]|nr:ATP-binding protein [Vicinamibacterales bacterium]
MACARCDGTGWQSIERDGIRRVQRCACWSDQIKADLIRSAKIPAQYNGRTLEALTIYPNEKFENTVRKARKWADEFPAVRRGFCIVGPPGIGKTHIAVAVLRRLILEKQIRGLYYDTRDLLKLIRSTYSAVTKTAEMDVLRPVMTAEVLLLDDLGAERPTEWVEETMNLIVNSRYNERRPTIFTTNYIDDVDDTNLDALKVRVGFRMHSRLHEMCDFLEYDGPDYRLFDGPHTPERLLALWKSSKSGRHRAKLPDRAHSQAKAGFKQTREFHELKWPGGKAGT